MPRQQYFVLHELRSREDSWFTIWNRDEERFAVVQDRLEALRLKLSPEKPTNSQIEAIIHTMTHLSKHKRKGEDGACACVFKHSSRDALMALATLLLYMRSLAIIPLQCMLVLVCS